MARFPNFLGPTYTLQSSLAGVERSVNLYPEYPTSPGAKSRVALYHTPGYSLFATSDESPGRGLFTEDGRCFTVIGHKLYELAADGTKTDRGSVVYDNNPVTFCSSGDAGGELFITSGDHGYILNLGTNVLTDEVSGARMGGYVDGFFVTLDVETSTVQISDLSDGTTWDPSQIAQRLAGSDRWISMLIAGKLIWLFGSLSTEVWYNAGTSPFPFALISGAVLQQGILAPFSAASLSGVPIWLGQTREGPAMVYLAGEGFTATRVSNHAVEFALQAYIRAGIDLSEAVAWTYQEDGHSFYVLNIPDADATWVYDATTQQWHERGWWDNSEIAYTASRAQFHCFAHNKHLVCDRLSGSIYEQALDQYSDIGGVEIVRMRRAGFPVRDRRRMVIPRFELYLDYGQGLVSGQGVDPKAMLRFSPDGGRTYAGQPMISTGRMGEYGPMVSWERLGQAQDPVFEVSFSDPVPWRLVDAFVDVQVGRH